MNLLSVSILEGATRKKIKSVRSTFRKSLRQASRVASSWFLMLVLLSLPPLMVLIATYISLQYTNFNIYQLTTLAQYEVIATIVWVIYALMHYSLVPCVALFEPAETLTSAFGRSRQLLRRKGRIFVLASYLLLSIYLLSTYLLAVYLENITNVDKWLTFGFSLIVALLAFNSLMVILYRKRRLARVN